MVWIPAANRVEETVTNYNGVSCKHPDWHTREVMQLAFEKLVLKVHRSLAPVLKSLMGHWLLAECDIYTPAAFSACQAFEAAFLKSLIEFCTDEICNVVVALVRTGEYALYSKGLIQRLKLFGVFCLCFFF